MRIRNTHRRQVGHAVESLGECLDSLSSAKDQLWPHEFWPLRNALLEDSLDKVGAHLNGGEWVQRGWPISVKFLRRILARRGRKS